MPKVSGEIEREYSKLVDTQTDQELGDIADRRNTNKKQYAGVRMGTVPFAELDRRESSWGKNIGRPWYERLANRFKADSSEETKCPVELKERTLVEVEEVLSSLEDLEDPFWWEANNSPLSKFGNKKTGRFKKPESRELLKELSQLVAMDTEVDDLKKWLDQNISRIVSKREANRGHKSSSAMFLLQAAKNLVGFIEGKDTGY